MITSHVKSRLGYAVLSGLKAMVSSFARTLYVLWLQTTGLVFGAFTLVGASQLVRVYHQHGVSGEPRRFWTTAGFTVVCLWFTVLSFWKAKRRHAGPVPAANSAAARK